MTKFRSRTKIFERTVRFIQNHIKPFPKFSGDPGKHHGLQLQFERVECDRVC